MHPALQLQRAVGNRAVERLIQRKRGQGDATGLAREHAAGEGNLLLQREPVSHDAHPAAQSVIRDAVQSPGERLDTATRNFMESGFNDDFADVRVHTDARAAASSQALGANAFASGSEIYFAAGKYAPGSQEGKRLLAHELAHTIQQRGHAPSLARQSNSIGDLAIDPDASLENEADRVAEQVVSSAPGEAGADRIALSRASEGPAIQRDVAPPLDDATRTSREQRAAEAIRRRDYRRLAEHDRPLEPDFEYEPLGDPNHVAQLAGRPRLDDLSDYQIGRAHV